MYFAFGPTSNKFSKENMIHNIKTLWFFKSILANKNKTQTFLNKRASSSASTLEAHFLQIIAERVEQTPYSLPFPKSLGPTSWEGSFISPAESSLLFANGNINNKSTCQAAITGHKRRDAFFQTAPIL
jgi:hypothetical protein